MSVLTLGELRKGVEAKRRTDPIAAEQLGAWVDGVETIFADRMLPVDAAAAKRWGELSAGRNACSVPARGHARDRQPAARGSVDWGGSACPSGRPCW